MNTLNTGASGYFSNPLNVLDPHLFDGEHLKPHVRNTIESLLLDYMESNYNNTHSWIMVWLAGSGISYQWSTNRGNGDLDVLFGIDYSQFVSDNPKFQWMSRSEITEAIDEDLKANLWPQTSRMPFYIPYDIGEFSGQVYEITFFLNNNVEDSPNSIVNIHPYAAYNVTLDEWTVRPPKNIAPMNYPLEYENKALTNKQDAEMLVSRYRNLTDQMSMTPINTPQWHNYNSSKIIVTQSIKNLFDEIHVGRKRAFSDQGEGYGDFYNYQWQAAKRDGIVNTLNEILNEEQ